MSLIFLANYVRSPGDPKVIESGPGSMDTADRLVRAIGWFSLGLGIVQIVAAKRIASTLGMDDSSTLIRAYGARELVSGVMTLSADKEIGLWSRVVGDTVDLATLAPALNEGNPERGNVKLAMAMVLGIAALDLMAAAVVSSRSRRETNQRVFNYRDRSGFPKGIEQARQLASKGANGSRHAPSSSPDTSFTRPTE